uniref:Protein quiver n=1 Tax=Bursaphelenchus xylophilus TaxID=6326 RepID=A0A1I7SI20_BURXY
MHLVLNLALFLFFASVTNSIRCYTCNEDASRRGTDCVKSKITIKDCGNDNGCIKGLLKLESLEIRYKKCAPSGAFITAIGVTFYVQNGGFSAVISG